MPPGHAHEWYHWDVPVDTTGDRELALGGTAATIYNMTASVFLIPLLQIVSIFES